jgi:hypothetical protein
VKLAPWLLKPRFAWLHVILVALFTVIFTILRTVMPWWLTDITVLGFAALMYAAATVAGHLRS